MKLMLSMSRLPRMPTKSWRRVPGSSFVMKMFLLTQLFLLSKDWMVTDMSCLRVHGMFLTQ